MLPSSKVAICALRSTLEVCRIWRVSANSNTVVCQNNPELPPCCLQRACLKVEVRSMPSEGTSPHLNRESRWFVRVASSGNIPSSMPCGRGWCRYRGRNGGRGAKCRVRRFVSEHRPFQFRDAFPTLRPPRLRLFWGPAPWTTRGRRTTCDALVEGCGSRLRAAGPGARRRWGQSVFHGRSRRDPQTAKRRWAGGGNAVPSLSLALIEDRGPPLPWRRRPGTTTRSITRASGSPDAK